MTDPIKLPTCFRNTEAVQLQIKKSRENAERKKSVQHTLNQCNKSRLEDNEKPSSPEFEKPDKVMTSFELCL